MSKAYQRLRTALAAPIMLLLAGSGGVLADPIADFYAGKQITFIVGSDPGGGYDAQARLVARHLSRFIPGNPTIVVQNMPGAGSLIAANYIANTAPKDGSAIAVLPNATIFEALLGNTKARFDARKLNMLGSLNDWTAVGLVWAETPFKTAQDLLTHEVVVGASAPGSGNSVLPNLLNSLVHTRFKVVNGYPGSAGIELALERHEVQAMVGDDLDMFKATRGFWLRDKKVRILLQARQTRHPELADVPTALELVSPENYDVLKLLIARQTYSGLFLAPPDVPAPAVASLRAGFAKMVEDADFRDDAKRSNLTVNPASAETVTATMGELLGSPQPVIARATAELQRIGAR
jgi:tripartite-type tricarboxylate transporter receptor subunit TctC